MKQQFFPPAVAVLLVVLCLWPRTGAAPAALAYAVVAWGDNDRGQTTVPLAAQSGVTAVAAGWAHTVALKNDGSVVSWGILNQTTVPLAAQSGVVAIAAGSGHTVALKNDGTVVVWGNNDYGQTTVPLAAQSGVTAIAAGESHTVALKNDGSVVAWGRNDYGQRTIPLAARSGVTAIAAGSIHTMALKNDGSVVAWGHNDFGPTRNDFGQTTVPVAAQRGVAAIAAGLYHSVALVTPTAPNITTQPMGQAVNLWQSASFTVVATGYPLNYHWRKDGVDLAGATSATYSLPLAHTNHAGSYTVVVSNSAGSVTSAPPAVLTVNPAAPGSVVAWGWNSFGQTPIPIAAQSGVVAIASAAHTVALKDDGSVVAWGRNHSGLIVPLAARSGVTAIAAGGTCELGCFGHTVALKDDGTVVAWGRNDHGQVTGTPATEGFPHSATATPVTLGGQVVSGVMAIAAGRAHTVALKNDGTVVAWGANEDGQVTGTPPTEGWPHSATASPVTLRGQVLSGVIAIEAGYGHTLALKNDGTVVAWGANGNGQVTGTPPTDEPYSAIASPVTLGGLVLSGVIAIGAGSAHNIALRNDGTVVAWGLNHDGQVTGTPTDDFIASPVILGGQVLGGVTAIAAGGSLTAAGGNHTVALRNDGTVVEWGATVTTEDPSIVIANPVTLEGQILSRVTAIAAGETHTIAIIDGVPLLPSLKARPNGNKLILSWPTNATEFALQSTLDLAPPVTWLDSTSVPAVIGTHFTLTNTPSGGAQFYRLRKM